MQLGQEAEVEVYREVPDVGHLREDVVQATLADHRLVTVIVVRDQKALIQGDADQSQEAAVIKAVFYFAIQLTGFAFPTKNIKEKSLNQIVFSFQSFLSFHCLLLRQNDLQS